MMNADLISRIHLELFFPSLLKDRQLWELILLKTMDTEYYIHENLDGLAQHELNGHEIRNIANTAYRLAGWKEDNLRYATIMRVINQDSAFKDYMRASLGGPADDSGLDETTGFDEYRYKVILIRLIQ